MPARLRVKLVYSCACLFAVFQIFLDVSFKKYASLDKLRYCML